MNMLAPILLTEEQAAEILHLAPRTLRDLRSKGKIRYIRQSPRKIAYTPEDCADYIDAHRTQDEPPCPSTNQRKAASGTTIFSGNVVGITARRAALRSAMPNGTKPKSGGRSR